MLLAVDIGNTSTSIGLFNGAELTGTYRIDTKTGSFESSYAELLDGIKGKIDNIVISSVVPEADAKASSVLKKLLGIEPVFINHKNAGIKIAFPKPEEIGADRLVDAVAAHEIVKDALIVLDFGTATTFDYVDETGTYYGGPIVPGIAVSNRALSNAASKLPHVEVKKAASLLPSSTEDAIQAGIYYGYLGMVEGIINRLSKETNKNPRLIATGGFASLFSDDLDIQVESNLTLNGIRLIYSRL